MATSRPGNSPVMSMLQETEVERHDVEAVNSGAKKKTPLYAAREKVYPKRAHGNFRRFKWWIMAVTLGIYYVTPWLRWDRGPYAPDQAVLIDLAASALLFLLHRDLAAGILLSSPACWSWRASGCSSSPRRSAAPGAATPARRRCGPTCSSSSSASSKATATPASSSTRRRGPSTSSRKRVPSIVVWLLIAVATGGAWIFYFADAPTLSREVFTRTGRLRRLRHDRRPDRHHLHLRRLHARAGLHLHVPLAAHPGGDARRGLAHRHLQRLARRAAHAPAPRRLPRRASAVGDCVDCNACVAVCPHGHRHPRRPAARMHHLRAVHRRLRRRHGQARHASAASSPIRRCATTITT